MMRKLLVGGVIVFSLMQQGCTTIFAGDPRWEIPIVSKGDCHPIDGHYLAYTEGKKVFLMAFFDDRTFYPVKNSLYRETYALDDWNTKYTKEQKSKWTVGISSTSENLTARLFDEHGTLLLERMVRLNDPRVGCDKDGNLTIRTFRLHQGGEWMYGSATAGEISFEKLPDGRLRYLSYGREWKRTMNKEPDESWSGTRIYEVAK